MNLLWIVVSVVLVVLFVYRIGLMVPRNHSASVRARYAQRPEEVWKAITDIDGLRTWREDLKSVERKPDIGGKPAWIEHSRHGALPFEVVEWEPPRKLVTRIADDDGKLPFGGTWTWTIRPVADGSEVTISEKGFIKPALFRLMTRYVFGYTRTMQQVMRALGKKFGETTEPRVV